jgi:phosphohistidine phosphatase
MPPAQSAAALPHCSTTGMISLLVRLSSLALDRSDISPQIEVDHFDEIVGMRKLLLMRHAKAAPQAGGGDRERPLTSRGQVDAERVGEYLKKEGLTPDAAVVSDARRTRETLDFVLRGLRRRLPFYVEPKLYNAPNSALLAALHTTRGEIGSLLVIGHNPGLATFALDLADEHNQVEETRLRERFPTAALAIFDFAIDNWQEVTSHGGRLERFVTPETLSDGKD